MPWIASQTIWRVNLFFLSLLPSFVLAGNPAPEDYLAGKPLVLEVRYCECQATKTDSASADLLPGFLKASSLLRISVSSKDSGFASSNELSIGFELEPVSGAPDQFQFNYAGHYITGHGKSAGNGELRLVKGQWVNLFGSRHENQTGSQHRNVAVRLAKPDGS